MYWYMQRRSLTARWGDVRAGFLSLVARNAIYGIAERPGDEKTWRPNILVLSGAPTQRWHLIQLADALSYRSGLMTVAAIVDVGTDRDRIDSLEATISEYLRKRGVSALVKVHPSSNVLAGARDLIGTYGFGPLVPNTIILGETGVAENFVDYARLMDYLYRTKRNLIMVREGKVGPIRNINPVIDIWWRGWTKYAAFKLALAYLMKRSPEWARARIVLKCVAQSSDQQDQMKQMREFIERSRLQADAEIIAAGGNSVYDVIRQSSSGSDLVFLGLRPPSEEETAEQYSEYYRKMLEVTQDMPPIVQTLNAEDVEFQRIFR
jgi:hypothetical protein